MPGSTLPFIPSEDSRIPILLIQRNGPLADQSAPTRLSEARTEQIDGWTLIVPWAFGSAFWRSLVYAGARTGGLDAIHNVYFDCGYSCFPYDYPTTPAFENYQEITGAAAQAKWERRPPSKRLNYTKLGFVSPHHIPFAHLLQATPTSSSMEYTYDQQTTTGGVLLQGNTLVSLLLDGSGGKTSIETALRTTMADAATARGMTFGAAPQHLLLESMAVKIKLSSEHGGTLKSRARIYLLQDDRFAQEYAACRNKRQVKRLDTVKVDIHKKGVAGEAAT
jgi:ribonuclease P/MRP protein subunit POP1